MYEKVCGSVSTQCNPHVEVSAEVQIVSSGVNVFVWLKLWWVLKTRKALDKNQSTSHLVAVFGSYRALLHAEPAVVSAGVGLFSLVLGLVCAQCCCRNTTHTPRSRNKLMDLEMDWHTLSPPPKHCSSANRKHPAHTRRHTPTDDFWDTQLFPGDGGWEWNDRHIITTRKSPSSAVMESGTPPISTNGRKSLWLQFLWRSCEISGASSDFFFFTKIYWNEEQKASEITATWK